MPVVTLPDGSQRRFDRDVTVAEVAASIGAGLARAALAGEVDGRLVDTSHRIGCDARLRIITARDPEGLEIIRHSTAHLLAQAVKQLFPEAQITIGPVIEDGFYYDFAFHRPFTPEDLERIEARMHELAKADQPVQRRVMPRDAAVAHFKSLGEHYKAEIIASIPAGEDISLYREGKFEDLCRGPHVPSTGKLKAFKLMKVAGAYWRGDSRSARCCSASTARPGRTRRIWRTISTGWRRPRSAITAASAANSTCSTSRTRPSGASSGTRRATRSGAASSSTCVIDCSRLDTRRCARRSCSTARCGRRRATGTITARTCSSPSPRSACSPSSR